MNCVVARAVALRGIITVASTDLAACGRSNSKVQGGGSGALVSLVMLSADGSGEDVARHSAAGSCPAVLGCEVWLASAEVAVEARARYVAQKYRAPSPPVRPHRQPRRRFRTSWSVRPMLSPPGISSQTALDQGNHLVRNVMPLDRERAHPSTTAPWRH